MTQPPPSRYKVVEQGRRLIVIDTLSGEPVARAPARPRDLGQASSIVAQPLSTSQRKVDDRSGLPVLVTSPLYDLNGPREIVLSETAQGTLTGAGAVAAIVATAWLIFAFSWPLGAFASLFVLFQPKAIRAVRQWITAQLDKSA